jgi:hypothetical protein
MRTLLTLCTALLMATPALAGRPLTVDDASVNDTGDGHVEAWYARQPGRVHTWTVAPAYAPIDGLELGAAFTRDRTTPQSSAAVQAKWRITPGAGRRLQRRCRAGRGAGARRGPHALHQRPVHLQQQPGAPPTSTWAPTALSGGPTLGAWGVAHEREFGAITAHVEAFGQRLAKPTFQIGARKDIAKGLQLDGTLGRSNRETLVSVGLKVSF